MVCEVSYSANSDSQQTIKEIRVLNAVLRNKCVGQLAKCEAWVNGAGG